MSNLVRYTALNEALRNEVPKPDRQSASFAAVTLVHTPGEVRDLARATRIRYGQLKEGLGNFKEPSGAMRWVYAATLAAHNVEAAAFLSCVRKFIFLEKRPRRDLFTPVDHGPHLYCA